MNSPLPIRPSARNLAADDGELYYLPGFLEPADAAADFGLLRDELGWEQEVVTIVGRRVPVPRLVAWHGDADAIYRYSGLTHYPKPWTPLLSELRRRIVAAYGTAFNSVLGNLYRGGNDSMGWHADQEKSLGRDPWIASLSLGARRLFKLRHNRSGQTLDLWLDSGSLLLMGGSLQHHWRHCVPKSRTEVGPRINLTFRRIFPED